MAHDTGQYCKCVSNHNPNPMELHRHHVWPLGMGGPNEDWNVLWLCPTSHTNAHELLRAWVKADGEPSWSILKHFGPYIRKVAQEGFELAKARGGNMSLEAVDNSRPGC